MTYEMSTRNSISSQFRRSSPQKKASTTTATATPKDRATVQPVQLDYEEIHGDPFQSRPKVIDDRQIQSVSSSFSRGAESPHSMSISISRASPSRSETSPTSFRNVEFDELTIRRDLTLESEEPKSTILTLITY